MAGEPVLFLADFALVIGAVALVALLFHKLRLPLILGYIIAGIILGALAPAAQNYGFVQNLSSIDLMSQLGIILLLFSIGLEFSLRKLRECGLVAIFIGVLEVAICIVGGYWVGLALGWSSIEALALGGIVGTSSTVIVVRALAAADQMKAPYAKFLVGVLVVEDAAGIIFLTIFSTMGSGAAVSLEETLAVAWKLLLFVITALAIGIYLIPKAVDRVAAYKTDEVLTVTVLGLCFGMAVFAYLLGFTASIGAFVMGIIVGESRSSGAVEQRIVPIRDFFVALFFTTIGFYVSLADLWAVLPLGIGIAALFMAMKFGSTTFASILGGRNQATALRIGTGMLAMGEFSFIIAQSATSGRLVHQPVYGMAIVATLLTAGLLPYSIKGGGNLVARFTRATPGRLQIYSSLTAGWVERLAERMGKSPVLASATRQFAIRMVVSVVIIGTILAAVRGIDPYTDSLSGTLGVEPLYLRTGVLLAATVLLVIQAVSTARRLRDFLELVAGHLVRSSPSARAVGRGVIISVLKNVVGATVAIGLMVLITLFLPAFSGRTTVIGGIILVLVVVFAWFVSSSLSRVNNRVETLFSSTLIGGDEKGKAMESSVKGILEDILSGRPVPATADGSPTHAPADGEVRELALEILQKKFGRRLPVSPAASKREPSEGGAPVTGKAAPPQTASEARRQGDAERVKASSTPPPSGAAQTDMPASAAPGDAPQAREESAATRKATAKDILRRTLDRKGEGPPG